MRVCGRISLVLLSLAWPCLAQAAEIDSSYTDGLVVRIPEYEAAFKLKGREHVDYNQAALDGETLENQAEVRRVWMDFSGTVQDWFFLSRVDLGEDSLPLETFLEYRGWGEHAWISFGRNKEPFGMSWLGSINNATIPERSAISDRYTLGRSLGIQVQGKYHNLFYAAGIFEDGSAESETPAEHVAVTGRLFSPIIHNNTQIVHLGLGFSQRQLRDVVGLEMAYVQQRWHVQSEYMTETLHDTDTSSSGVYLEAGYFLTEDSMRYGNGVFQSVKPNSSNGAWQVVVRVDEGDGDYSDIELGNSDARAFAVGLNYYANTFFRVAASYTRGQPHEDEGLTGEEWRMRAQFTF